jgi:hypothetical protein
MVTALAVPWFYRGELKDCVRELGFGAVKGLRSNSVHTLMCTLIPHWKPAFLSGTGRVILPTYLPTYTEARGVYGRSRKFQRTFWKQNKQNYQIQLVTSAWPDKPRVSRHILAEKMSAYAKTARKCDRLRVPKIGRYKTRT